MAAGTPRTLAAQCEAKSHTTGERCRRPAVKGKRVCRYHGGITCPGPLNGNYRTGRHSKHLSGQLLASYHAALNDPDLLSVRDELALLDTRITAVLDKLPKGEPGAMWADLQRSVQAFRAAETAHDVTAMRARLTDMEAAIADGLDEQRAWAEIVGLVEKRARLSEVETKRMVEAHAMIRMDEMGMFIAQIIEAVRTNVTDRRALVAIITTIEGLIGGPRG